MIFKRKKSAGLSSTSNESIVDGKSKSRVETLYMVAMCFVAACLSFVALEVGARSPLGHSVTNAATFNSIFRRSYNLKIKIRITNVIMALITTAMLAVGDSYGVPYLYVPWLVNTMKGMIFYEGPTLLGLSYTWLPDTGIAAATFVFITFLLFVEEFCIWMDVLSCFKRSWLDYAEPREEPCAKPANALRLIQPVNDYKDRIAELALAKSKVRNKPSGPDVDQTMTRIIAQSNFSDTAIEPKSSKSFDNDKPNDDRSKTLEIADPVQSH